jgi:hypothetical protein
VVEVLVQLEIFGPVAAFALGAATIATNKNGVSNTKVRRLRSFALPDFLALKLINRPPRFEGYPLIGLIVAPFTLRHNPTDGVFGVKKSPKGEIRVWLDYF